MGQRSMTALVLTAGICLACPARAETLEEALAAALASNPVLGRQQAVQSQLSERVDQARGAGRPTLGVNVGVTEQFRGENSFVAVQEGLNASATLTVPLYTGGRVGAGVRAAEERRGAGEAELRSVEHQIVLAVVTAYADVLRDLSIVERNRGLVEVLSTQLDAARARFDAGEVTRTDIAQAEARLAAAEANLAVAEAQLSVSEEAYRRVVGHSPSGLVPPGPLAGFPGTADEAVSLALDNNPGVRAARLAENAARADIDAALSEYKPNVSVQLGASYFDPMGSGGGAVPGLTLPRGDAQTATLNVTVPLYQGGVTSSRVREAKARRAEQRSAVEIAERAVEGEVRSAFVAVVAARRSVAAALSSVKANEIAVRGTRAENAVGQRTLLDVLNAEQDLLAAQITLAGAQRDELVASMALLTAIGQSSDAAVTASGSGAGVLK